jgi:hypothetical protein
MEMIWYRDDRDRKQYANAEALLASLQSVVGKLMLAASQSAPWSPIDHDQFIDRPLELVGRFQDSAQALELPCFDLLD